MATVTLDRLWLHRADNLGTYLRFFTSDRADERTKDGAVMSTASGRLRVITRVTKRKEIAATLRQVTWSELDTLEGWMGDVLLVRDHRGRLMFATFFSMSVADYPDRSGADVTVTFSEVTSSVVV